MLESGHDERCARLRAFGGLVVTPRVRVPNYHILSKSASYITSTLNPSNCLILGSFGSLGVDWSGPGVEALWQPDPGTRTPVKQGAWRTLVRDACFSD